MTKKQVKTKVNNLIMEYTKKLENEIEGILKDADMWYGYTGSGGEGSEGFSMDDHNGDLFAKDGVLDGDVSIWLHTRKELRF